MAKKDKSALMDFIQSKDAEAGHGTNQEKATVDSARSMMSDFLGNVAKEKVVPGETRRDLADFNKVEASELPSGEFYPRGTQVYIKPVLSIDVLQYSYADDSDERDVWQRMDILLAKYVRVVLPTGEILDYTYLKKYDRVFVILLLREMTFVNTNYFNIIGKCECGKPVEVPLYTKFIKRKEIDAEIWDMYDAESNCFVFNTVMGETWNLGVPNISMVKEIDDFCAQLEEIESILAKFFKDIVPCVLHDRVVLKSGELHELYNNFQSIDPETMLFLQDICQHIKTGIDTVGYRCGCGKEGRLKVFFRDGYKSIFKLQGGYRALLQQPQQADVPQDNN